MFGFFDSPFYTPRYRQARTYRESPFDYLYGYQSPMDRYLNRLENQFNEIMNQAYEDELAEYGRLKELRERAQQQQQQQRQAAPQSVKQEEKPKTEAIKDAAPKPSQPQFNAPRQGYFFERHQSYNGKDYIEEHRECVTDSDGHQYNSITRRLGDRWYKNEEHIDTDGKKSSKETWHNVSDNEIDSFKQEWSEKRGGAIKQAPQPEAVKDESKPAEETKTEEQPKPLE